ncbi:class I adenylate-forming enzyme family protein [Nocardia sp. CA-135953]|uniref:class I adenylate-forming enzyme family protein n=1 Tax=Nocardia sp. CA-135953 TaxID=3239978 RepID=UPI003D96B2C4
MGLPEQIRRIARRSDDEPAVCYSGVWWTAAQLSRGVDRIDALLREAGVGDGVPVGIYMRNRPGHVAALAALLGFRRPLVVLSPLNPDATVASDVLALGPAAVLADGEDWKRTPIRDATESIGALGLLLEMPADRMNVVFPRRADAEVGAIGEDVAILMLTSGTTGPPKRIPLRFSEIEHALDSAQEHYVGKVGNGAKVRGGGVQIVSLPPVNISGLWALITALTGAGRSVLTDRFEPKAWAALVAEHAPSSVSVPPAALRMLLDAELDPSTLCSLKAVWAGAAPVGPELAAEFEERFGCPVLLSYGATEFTGGITGWSLRDWNSWKSTKRGSVGRPHPGVQITVVDSDSDEPLPAGESGVLLVRSAQAVGGSAAGWVRTNDIGRVDEDGFVWIDGRSDDVINRGGFKVFPAELEHCLEEHPAVREAVVVGIADERLGQVPAAAVVARTPVEDAELVAWVKSKLQSYKAPTQIMFVGEIPKNPAMKPLRGEVRAMLADNLAANPT